MYRIAIYLILILKAADSRITEKRSYYVPKQSAATASQIRFAEENKYDDTGPGAKEPQAAYKTFKTLEEALVAYLDDPDTKLPESEMVKAYKKLLSQKEYKTYPKHQTQAIFLTKYQNNHPNKYYTSKMASVFPAIENKYSSALRRAGDIELEVKDLPRPFKLEKVKDESPAHAGEDKPEDDPDPEYTYSYGVHNRSKQRRVSPAVSSSRRPPLSRFVRPLRVYKNSLVHICMRAHACSERTGGGRLSPRAPRQRSVDFFAGPLSRPTSLRSRMEMRTPKSSGDLDSPLLSFRNKRFVVGSSKLSLFL